MARELDRPLLSPLKMTGQHDGQTNLMRVVLEPCEDKKGWGGGPLRSLEEEKN